jgi:hypothetical protein
MVVATANRNADKEHDESVKAIFGITFDERTRISDGLTLKRCDHFRSSFLRPFRAAT